jgi:hypothetical protein
LTENNLTHSSRFPAVKTPREVRQPERGIPAATLQLPLRSDGLTEMMKHEAIEAVLAAEREPDAAARALVAQANDRGGRDNITVVIVRFDPVRIEAAPSFSTTDRASAAEASRSA